MGAEGRERIASGPCRFTAEEDETLPTLGQARGLPAASHSIEPLELVKEEP